MEYFVISAKFVPLKYYTLSSQLQRLTSFSVGCSGRRILSPGQIAVMRKWSILLYNQRFQVCWLVVMCNRWVLVVDAPPIVCTGKTRCMNATCDNYDPDFDFAPTQQEVNYNAFSELCWNAVVSCNQANWIWLSEKNDCKYNWTKEIQKISSLISVFQKMFQITPKELSR